MNSPDVFYEKLYNLICFNANFSEFVNNNSLLHQSPDYIKEKYDHWIGLKQVVNLDHLNQIIHTQLDGNTRIKIFDFYQKYNSIWGDRSKYIISQLFYLICTKNIKISEMRKYFEMFIGPISEIDGSGNKFGLHEIIYRDFIPVILEKNTNEITTILRDIKLEYLSK